MLDHAWICDRAEKEISALADVIAGAPDIAAGVPSCPGWTVADLARHVGTEYRWAGDLVRDQAATRPPRPEATSPWESADGWAQWLVSASVPLLDTLREAGPLTPVWSWGPGRTSGWWARRILHETVVHRADLELALGAGQELAQRVREPDIDPAVAADGIDEFLFNLPSARRPYRLLADLPAGDALQLRATDSDGEWLIRFTDSGIAWERGHAPATTAVRGPVTSLLLFVYGRRPVADRRLCSAGDTALAALWQEKTAL